MILIDPQPDISNKMKFYTENNGNWMIRVRTNQCHQFHDNDRINIGFIKMDLNDITMKISLRIMGKESHPIKSCQNHAAKYRNKVRFS